MTAALEKKKIVQGFLLHGLEARVEIVQCEEDASEMFGRMAFWLPLCCLALVCQTSDRDVREKYGKTGLLAKCQNADGRLCIL